MYNHNKAQQSKNPVHISWDILYALINNGEGVKSQLNGTEQIEDIGQ